MASAEVDNSHDGAIFWSKMLILPNLRRGDMGTVYTHSDQWN